MSDPQPIKATSPEPAAPSIPVAPPVAERGPEPLVYRPLSGWAVGGFVLACLFVGAVFLSAVIALLTGGAFVLVVLGKGWLAFAFAAVILSFLGQSEIRKSEGTRAGAKLAAWGLWMSVV